METVQLSVSAAFPLVLLVSVAAVAVAIVVVGKRQNILWENTYPQMVFADGTRLLVLCRNICHSATQNNSQSVFCVRFFWRVNVSILFYSPLSSVFVLKGSV